MTAREVERLAKLEQKVDDLNSKVEDGFKDIKDRLDHQSALRRWMVGVVISLATLILLAWKGLTKG